jgi:hypothetical protein
MQRQMNFVMHSRVHISNIGEKRYFYWVFSSNAKINPSDTQAWVAYHGDKPVAGLAVYDYGMKKDINSSVHMVAFTREEWKPLQVGHDSWIDGSHIAKRKELNILILIIFEITLSQKINRDILILRKTLLKRDTK